MIPLPSATGATPMNESDCGAADNWRNRFERDGFLAPIRMGYVGG